MSDALYISATGMYAQQQQIDVIANNLSNVNTPAFKKSRVVFEDLMYRNQPTANITSIDDSNKTGVGAAVSSTNKVFSQGDIKQTDRDLDLAIRGEGFFEVLLPDGSYGYTRTGTFRVNNDGILVSDDGHQINPHIQIPSDAEQVIFNADGTVMAKLPGEDSVMEIGSLELASFVNASGLNALGNNLYTPTAESGDVFYNRPGENGAGLIAQGYLESSNVKLVEELTNLMLAQRAYEINSKVIQAIDETMNITNNLRR